MAEGQDSILGGFGNEQVWRKGRLLAAYSEGFGTVRSACADCLDRVV